MKSEFLITVADSSQFHGLFNGPFLKGHRQPRIAVVGRSNVGKSSLLNSLLGSRLARVSNQPGKTRAIHCYSCEALRKILVDLPGYGYARVAKDERERWKEFIGAYFEEEANLDRALLLMDSRHPPADLDEEALDFLSSKSIPVTFVLTKLDTLKTQAIRAQRQKELGAYFSSKGVPKEFVFWVSSKTGDGIKPLISHLKSG